MGNKPSAHGHAHHPHNGKYSYQPDPGHRAPVPPKGGPYPPHFGAHGDPRAGGGRPRAHSISNGSIIQDDAVFGGVHPMRQAEPGQKSHGAAWTNSPNQSPTKKSVDNSDSGYFTGVDSDPKNRGKVRGSRLSLNDAMLFGGQGPPEGFVPNGMQGGPQPPPMHPHVMHAMMMQDPVIGLIPPNMDPKKAKKLHKKLLKKHMKGELGPLPQPGFAPMPPPGPFAVPFRAQSMDNLAMQGLVQPVPFPPNDVQNGARRFNSTLDLSTPMIQQIYAPPDPFIPRGGDSTISSRNRKMKKEHKSKAPKSAARGPLASDKISVPSEKGSRRSRGGSCKNEPTHFEEERPPINEMILPVAKNSSPPSTSFPQPDTRNDRDNVIYETLKGNKLLATAEIATPTVGKTPNEQEIRQNVMNISAELNETRDSDLPLRISPNAQAVMDRNAQLLGYDEEQEKAAKLAKKTPSPLPEPHIANNEDKAVVDTAGEKEIMALRNPTLPRLKTSKPKDFEPLDAWRSIDVEKEMLVRQPQRNQPDPGNPVDEKITVQLLPAPPSRSEVPGEPIYFDYDEKLPDFKKRLIETGSFDFPEKVRESNHNSPDRPSPASKNSDVQVVTNIDKISPAKPPSVEQKAEATGLVPVAPPLPNDLYHRPANLKLDTSVPRAYAVTSNQPTTTTSSGGRAVYRPGDYRYTSSGSLTPSTANIQAGDQSDIDFSWVHDLETKFRREKEQYDREFDDVHQRSLQRGLDKPTKPVPETDYPASPEPPRNMHQKVKYLPNGDLQSFDINDAVGSSTPNRTDRKSFKAQPNGDILDNSFNQQEDLQPHYFGQNDLPQLSYQLRLGAHRPSKEEELRQIESNVRAKTALFESEAQRAARESSERSKHRHYSPQRYPQDPQPFIPMPDYDGDQRQSYAERQNRYQYMNGQQRQLGVNGGIEYSMHNELQVETHQQATRLSAGGYRVQKSPRSPSERKLQRMEMQRHQESNVAAHSRTHQNGGVHYVHDKRLSAYNEANGHIKTNGVSPTDPVAIQKGRVYHATEFYRQNYLDERNRQLQNIHSRKQQPDLFRQNNPDYSHNKTVAAYHGSEMKLNQTDFKPRAAKLMYTSQPALTSGYGRPYDQL